MHIAQSPPAPPSPLRPDPRPPPGATSRGPARSPSAGLVPSCCTATSSARRAASVSFISKSSCFLNLRKILGHQTHLSSDCIGDAAAAAVAARWPARQRPARRRPARRWRSAAMADRDSCSVLKPRPRPRPVVIYRSLETGAHRSRSLETGAHRSRLGAFLNARVAVARESLVSVIPRPMTPGLETNDPSVSRPTTNGLESLGFRRVAGTDNFLPTTQRTCEHYYLPLKTASLTSWRRFGEVFSILSLFPQRNSILHHVIN